MGRRRRRRRHPGAGLGRECPAAPDLRALRAAHTAIMGGMEPGKRGPGHRACRQARAHADWLGTEHPWGSVADGPAVGWAHVDKWGVELRSAY